MEGGSMKASLVFTTVLTFIAILIYALGRAYSFTDVYQLGLKQYFASLFLFIVAIIILIGEVLK
jgi:EamA domain-containing membrane protein RarD